MWVWQNCRQEAKILVLWFLSKTKEEGLKNGIREINCERGKINHTDDGQWFYC